MPHTPIPRRPQRPRQRQQRAQMDAAREASPIVEGSKPLNIRRRKRLPPPVNTRQLQRQRQRQIADMTSGQRLTPEQRISPEQNIREMIEAEFRRREATERRPPPPPARRRPIPRVPPLGSQTLPPPRPRPKPKPKTPKRKCPPRTTRT